MALAEIHWPHPWPGQTQGSPLLNEWPQLLIFPLEEIIIDRYMEFENVVSMLLFSKHLLSAYCESGTVRYSS